MFTERSRVNGGGGEIMFPRSFSVFLKDIFEGLLYYLKASPKERKSIRVIGLLEEKELLLSLMNKYTHAPLASNAFKKWEKRVTEIDLLLDQIKFGFKPKSPL